MAPHDPQAADSETQAAPTASAGPSVSAFKPESEVLITTTFGPPEFVERWANGLRAHGLRVQTWPDGVTDLSRVEFAVCFDPPPGLLARCPLKGIHSMGAGVSAGMLDDVVCPSSVPLLRVVEPRLAQRMSTFCLWAVINCQRKCDTYWAAQQARRWDLGKAVENFWPVDNGDFRVGVMGAGNLGLATVELLQKAGYAVNVWTRTWRQLAGTSCFHGRQQLRQFAAGTDAVICLVPLTEETRGILNAEFFSWLPAGASVINVSRGQHVVDADLVAALDSGHLAGAILDVFHQEPLPPESPLWSHPKIRVFPHASATPDMPATAAQMVRMRELVLAGKPLPPGVLVDRRRGY